MFNVFQWFSISIDFKSVENKINFFKPFFSIVTALWSSFITYLIHIMLRCLHENLSLFILRKINFLCVTCIAFFSNFVLQLFRIASIKSPSFWLTGFSIQFFFEMSFIARNSFLYISTLCPFTFALYYTDTFPDE